MTDAEIIAQLAASLRGIASCATRCGCCEMHQRIAADVLKRTGQEQKPPEIKP